MKKERTTDPYGHLEFCIGSGDDFWCFDYATLPNGNIRLHAIINSETGSFIMNAESPIEVPPGEAFAEATRLEGEAVDWCTENNVEHDAEGWDQDPGYFARAVHCAVTQAGRPIRRAVEMVRRPLITGNYL